MDSKFFNIFVNLPTLETERLILRKLIYEDVDDIYEYAKIPKVSEYVLWYPHTSKFESLEYLNLVYEKYNHGEPAPWGIILKETGKLIGSIGFVKIDEKESVGEIGYVISPFYWNRGFATEAVRSVVQFGFAELELTKVTAHTITQNRASGRVLLRVGFNFDGTKHGYTEIKNKPVDIDFYSIQRNGYEKASGNFR
jgi:ribosomal-protein-alanine N-acetyltransferase